MEPTKTTTKMSWRKVLEEHKEIARTITALGADVVTFVAGEEGLRERLIEDTSHLIELLIEHFDEEEREEGLYADLMAAVPRHAPHIEGLKAEHRQFLVDLQQVQGELRGEGSMDLDAFATFVKELIKRLHRHEGRENELVTEAAGGNPLGIGD